jgi:hypothetical protein
METTLYERFKRVFSILDKMLIVANIRGYAEWRSIAAHDQHTLQARAKWLNEERAKGEKLFFSSILPLETILAIGSLLVKPMPGPVLVENCAIRAKLDSGDQVIIGLRTGLFDPLDLTLAVLARVLLERPSLELLGHGFIYERLDKFNEAAGRIDSQNETRWHVHEEEGKLPVILEHNPMSAVTNSLVWHLRTDNPREALNLLWVHFSPLFQATNSHLPGVERGGIFWTPPGKTAMPGVCRFGIAIRDIEEPMPVTVPLK